MRLHFVTLFSGISRHVLLSGYSTNSGINKYVSSLDMNMGEN